MRDARENEIPRVWIRDGREEVRTSNPGWNINWKVKREFSSFTPAVSFRFCLSFFTCLIIDFVLLFIRIFIRPSVFPRPSCFYVSRFIRHPGTHGNLFDPCTRLARLRGEITHLQTSLLRVKIRFSCNDILLRFRPADTDTGCCVFKIASHERRSSVDELRSDEIEFKRLGVR